MWARQRDGGRDGERESDDVEEKDAVGGREDMRDEGKKREVGGRGGKAMLNRSDVAKTNKLNELLHRQA